MKSSNINRWISSAGRMILAWLVIGMWGPAGGASFPTRQDNRDLVALQAGGETVLFVPAGGASFQLYIFRWGGSSWGSSTIPVPADTEVTGFYGQKGTNRVLYRDSARTTLTFSVLTPGPWRLEAEATADLPAEFSYVAQVAPTADVALVQTQSNLWLCEPGRAPRTVPALARVRAGEVVRMTDTEILVVEDIFPSDSVRVARISIATGEELAAREFDATGAFHANGKVWLTGETDEEQALRCIDPETFEVTRTLKFGHAYPRRIRELVGGKVVVSLDPPTGGSAVACYNGAGAQEWLWPAPRWSHLRAVSEDGAWVVFRQSVSSLAGHRTVVFKTATGEWATKFADQPEVGIELVPIDERLFLAQAHWWWDGLDISEILDSQFGGFVHAPNPYDLYVLETFGLSADRTLVRPNADFDGDGVLNMVEFAQGGDLQSADQPHGPMFETVEYEGEVALKIRYRQSSRHAAGWRDAGGVETEVQFASSRDNRWRSYNATIVHTSEPVDNGDGSETVEVIAKPPAGISDLMARLRWEVADF